MRLSASNFALIIFCALVTGCATCNPYMGTEPFLKIRYEKKDWYGLPSTYDAAKKHYLYAQMAANSYNDPEESFVLPAHISEISELSPFDAGYGLQGKVFAIKGSDGTATEVVVAFRGTEGLGPAGLKDWAFGNILGVQYSRAGEFILKVRSQNPNARLIAVGHSLGGGLALHASICFDGVSAITFNPSFRVFGCSEEKSNDRVVFAETDDVLAIQRGLWRDPKGIESYDGFYCSLLNNHGMFRLARCLTHVAAAVEPSAEKSISSNPVAACGVNPPLKPSTNGKTQSL
jgi:hypothetical protein